MLPHDMQLKILSFVSHEDKVNFALTCRGFQWMLLQERVGMFVSALPDEVYTLAKAVDTAEISAKKAGAAAQEMHDRAAGGNADLDSAMGFCEKM
jgi:hypothetical protein